MNQTNEIQESAWNNLSKEEKAGLVVAGLTVIGILYLLFRSGRTHVPEIANSVTSDVLRTGLSVADIASRLSV